MNDQVQEFAMKVVEIVLQQRLVHPITCVPYLMDFEVDQMESNSNLSHSLLMHMNEKYPYFFESCLGDGIQLSFIFIQSGASSFGQELNTGKVSWNIKNKSDGRIYASEKVGIYHIYKLIRGSHISRNKFI